MDAIVTCILGCPAFRTDDLPELHCADVSDVSMFLTWKVEKLVLV